MRVSAAVAPTSMPIATTSNVIAIPMSVNSLKMLCSECYVCKCSTRYTWLPSHQSPRKEES